MKNTNGLIQQDEFDRIKKENAFLKQIFSSINAFIYKCNLKTFNIEWYNSEAFLSNLLGLKLTNSDFTLNNILGYLHPKDKFLILQRGELYTKKETVCYSNFIRLKKSDNNWQWVLLCSKVFERDSAGKPISTIGFVADVVNNLLSYKSLETMLKMVIFDNIKSNLNKSLTETENEILSSLLEGDCPKEIAANRNASYSTIRKHITNMHHKGLPKTLFL